MSVPKIPESKVSKIENIHQWGFYAARVHAIDADFEIWKAYYRRAMFTGTNALLDRVVCTNSSAFTEFL